jgi:hypothetical protein
MSSGMSQLVLWLNSGSGKLRAMRITPKFQQAVKVGFITFWLCWLVGATQVLPLLSLHQDFAHAHAPDTPFHTHAITILFTVAAAIVIATGIPGKLTYRCQRRVYALPHAAKSRFVAFDTRAPPL